MAEKLKLLEPAQYAGPEEGGSWIKVSDLAEIVDMSPDEIWNNFSAGVPDGFVSWNADVNQIYSEEKPENFGENLIPMEVGKYIRGLNSLGVRNMEATRPNHVSFRWETT